MEPQVGHDLLVQEQTCWTVTVSGILVAIAFFAGRFFAFGLKNCRLWVHAHLIVEMYNMALQKILRNKHDTA